MITKLLMVISILVTIYFSVSCWNNMDKESRDWATTLVAAYPDSDQTFNDSMMIIFIKSDEFKTWYDSDYLGTMIAGSEMNNDRVMRSMTTTIQMYNDAKYYEDEWKK